jgi:tRNA-(ms[2]io[6]A)-hydroxylase
MSNLNYDELMQPVIDFLGCTTPQAWLDEAVNHLDILMQDHANCEKGCGNSDELNVPL